MRERIESESASSVVARKEGISFTVKGRMRFAYGHAPSKKNSFRLFFSKVSKEMI
jgi:hypothetical protein